MSILSKTGIMKWGNKFSTYYQEKGYPILKQGEEFEVKIEDLPHSSVAEVEIQCDGKCKHTRFMKYQNYMKMLQEDGKYYCKECVKDYKKENNISKEVKNISFE